MEYTLELKEFGNGNKVISELNKEITIDVNMIGEGIVFSTNVNGIIYRMKVKGDKHSKSKVRVLKQVDNEKINNAINTAQKVCKNWRMEQMLVKHLILSMVVVYVEVNQASLSKLL